MDKIAERLKAYTDTHPFDPGDSDCETVLDQLCHAYAEYYESDSPKIISYCVLLTEEFQRKIDRNEFLEYVELERRYIFSGKVRRFSTPHAYAAQRDHLDRRN